MKNYIETILNFLTEIKIAYEMTDLKNKTLLPGLFIQNGILQIDINKDDLIDLLFFFQGYLMFVC